MSEDLPTPFGDKASQLDALNGINTGARPNAFGDVRNGEPAHGGAQLARMLSAIGRYKWLLLVCALAGGAAGFMMRRFSPPVYHAEATVWIQVPSEREAQRGPIRSANLLTEANGWMDLLRSFAVLDHVVLEQRLYLSGSLVDRSTLDAFHLAERFRPGQYVVTTDKAGKRYELKDEATGTVLERGAVGDSIGRALGFRWAPSIPAGRTLNFSLTTPREAARRLGERLVTTVRQTQRQEQNFIRLSLEGADPNAIASVVNAVADRFVAVGAEMKRSQLSELVQILETQRLYAERNLRDAEIALEGFRVQTITLPSDNGSPVTPGLEATEDPVMDNYFEMKIQREQLRRDMEGVQQALTSAREQGATADALSALPSTSQSPELTAALNDLTTKRSQLRALRQQYTAEHPVVQRLTNEIQTQEQQTIPRLGEALLSQLGTRANILDGWINSASADLQSIPPRMIEEARLRRNVQIAERLHTNLRERYEEARLATATIIPDVRVLDRATPADGPVASTALQFVLVGLFGGLALGLGLAILFDRVDPRLRYPDQVTRQLGLPILGALPHVRNGSNSAAANATTQAIEALREVRLNLLHSVQRQHPLVLAISSPGPGDGKTFISCNLALACAGAGQRTLIIDGDTRRGELHRLLNGQRSPGLTDHLRGEAQLASVIQPTAYPGLDFIGSGTRREASPNLLGNATMEEMLRNVYRSYDVVLFDCPPLAAGVDPYLIGTLVGNVMLVLRTGRTDRALTEAKLQILDRLPVQLVGAVLNDVKATGVYRYYSYLTGYEPPADEVVDAGRQLQGV
ncbi:MAG TPA: polysaccharide biosynthesis tyrosine autokinase [Longimicrobiales bacterium]